MNTQNNNHAICYAANVHFKTLSDGGEYSGGYGWFFGKFKTWAEFYESIEAHLTEIDYCLINIETSQQICDLGELVSEEQKQLVRLLDKYPLQYRTLHMYESNDF